MYTLNIVRKVNHLTDGALYTIRQFRFDDRGQRTLIAQGDYFYIETLYTLEHKFNARFAEDDYLIFDDTDTLQECLDSRQVEIIPDFSGQTGKAMQRALEDMWYQYRIAAEIISEAWHAGLATYEETSQGVKVLLNTAPTIKPGDLHDAALHHENRFRITLFALANALKSNRRDDLPNTDPASVLPSTVLNSEE